MSESKSVIEHYNYLTDCFHKKQQIDYYGKDLMIVVMSCRDNSVKTVNDDGSFNIDISPFNVTFTLSDGSNFTINNIPYGD